MYIYKCIDKGRLDIYVYINIIYIYIYIALDMWSGVAW